MAFEVEWTKSVLQTLDGIACYLKCEWSQEICDKFVKELLDRVKVLTLQPNMGMVSTRNPAVRSIKISKHNRLYYRVENNKVVLLDIFDLRQHPDKNIYS